MYYKILHTHSLIGIGELNQNFKSKNHKATNSMENFMNFEYTDYSPRCLNKILGFKI